jgi:O-antigen ligase
MNTNLLLTLPRRITSAIVVETAVWLGLFFFIVLRRNFNPLPLTLLVGGLLVARVILYTPFKRVAPATTTLLFPSPIFVPAIIWVALLAMGYWLTLDLIIAQPRLWFFIMGMVTLGSIYNISNTLSHNEHFNFKWGIWLTLALWMLFSLVMSLGGAITASWVFLNKVPLLQRLFPDYEVRIVQLANDQSTNVNLLMGILTPQVFVPFGLIIALKKSDLSHPFKHIGMLAGYVFAGLIVVMLLLTQSYGGYFAVAIGAIVFLALRRPKLWWVLAFLVAAALIVFVIYLPTLRALTADELDMLIRKRYYIWLRALLMIRDMPLSGIGLGMFPYATRLLYSYMITHIVDQPPHAHNLLLELGLDFGVLGMVCFVAIAVLIWQRGLRAIRAAPNTPQAWLLCGLLASQAVWLTFNLTDLAYLGSRSSFIYWGAWGLILVFSRDKTLK